MAISPHIARLRAAVGSELLLLPSVSVLPTDAAGRLLLGTPEADGDELVAVGWFDRAGLSTVDLNGFAAAVLRATDHLPGPATVA